MKLNFLAAKERISGFRRKQWKRRMKEEEEGNKDAEKGIRGKGRRRKRRIEEEGEKKGKENETRGGRIKGRGG